MWRPFASHFAKNSYTSFIKQASKLPPRPPAKTPQSPTTAPPPPSEPSRDDKFAQLQKRVQRQRLLIKQRDSLMQTKKQQQQQTQNQLRLKRILEKRDHLKHVRSMANNKASRSNTPGSINKAPARARGISSGHDIFSLTAAESQPLRLSSRTPYQASSRAPLSARPLISLEKYQEKLLKKFEQDPPEVRRKVIAEFENIRKARTRRVKTSHYPSVLPDIKTIRKKQGTVTGLQQIVKIANQRQSQGQGLAF